MPRVTGPAADAGVHDLPALLALVGNDEELMREIIALFLREYKRLMTDIRDAAAAGDVRALQFSAHAMKGCVGNMAAPRAYKAAMDLEVLARDDQLPAARIAATLLEDELLLLHDALASLIPGPAT